MTDISAYDYELPEELIAQQPLQRRDQARLMIVDRAQAAISHRSVCDLPELLRPGDALVFNNTKVVPARLVGRRTKTGGAWEGLFLQLEADGRWQILSRTRGKLQAGETVTLIDERGADGAELRLEERREGGVWIVAPTQQADCWSLLDQVGRVPLPPYIRGGQMHEEDRNRYQTVYAANPGAVAAPTAGLHFTAELMETLRAGGIGMEYVTLHVGLGTFRPVAVEWLEEHQMHAEWGELQPDVAERLCQVRSRGGRIIAVGTTSVRVLESAAATAPQADRPLCAWSGWTSLFIRPPYQFRAVDGLLTNFHLPRSTLLVLVRTLGGDQLLQQAYEEAVRERYRFFSYGDAMLIV